MAVDNETVKDVAALAHIKIADDKLEETKNQFNKILNWIEQLNEVDTQNVEALSSINEDSLQCRPDIINDGNQKAAVLQNAPAAEFGYFAVPKVVE